MEPETQKSDSTRKIRPADPTVAYRVAPKAAPEYELPEPPTRPIYAAPPPPRRRKSWQRRLVAVLGGGVGLALGIVGALILSLFLLLKSDLIWPGVQVMGVDLGGLTRPEAELMLAQTWAGKTVTLTGDEISQPLTPAQLGLALNTAETVSLAHTQSRTGAALKAWLAGAPIGIWPVWQSDPNLASQTLNELARQFAVPPIDASLKIVAGHAEGTPSLSGRALDVAATVAALEQNTLQTVMNGRLDAVLVSIAPPVADVSAAVEQANQLLANSLTVRVYDPVVDEAIFWTIGPEIWGNWIAVSRDEAGNLAWQVQPELVEAHMALQADALGEERYLQRDEATSAVVAALENQSWYAGLRARYRPRQHTVQSGETLSGIGYDYGIPYPWLQQANPGVENLFAGQAITIPPADALIPLPVVENKRIVISISQQAMWAYQDGALIWNWPVSTGIDSSPTSPGVFQVQTHFDNAYAANWDLWMPHFIGIYRPVPTNDFMNGFHGFPTRGESQLLWTSSLGHPVTYGCILLHSDNAALLYTWAEDGVVVEIRK